MSRFAGLMVTPPPPPLRRGQAGQFFIILQKMANRIVFKLLRSFCDCFRKLAPLSQQIPNKATATLSGPFPRFRLLACLSLCLPAPRDIFRHNDWSS